MVSIIESGIIRASNVQFSNDPAEVTYGHKVIREVLQQSFSNMDLSEVFEIITEIDYYAISFSAVGDSLPQWRAYCSNGQGVALGFHSAAFAQHEQLSFGRVEYDRSKQQELVRSLIDVYAPKIRRLATDNQRRAPVVAALARLFVVVAGIIKDEAYASEHEYRAFTTQPRPREWHLFPVKFRATQTSVVPYLEFAFTSTNFAYPLTEIMLGPCLDVALTRPSIEAFVAQVIKTSIDVKSSVIKMRI